MAERSRLGAATRPSRRLRSAPRGSPPCGTPRPCGGTRPHTNRCSSGTRSNSSPVPCVQSEALRKAGRSARGATTKAARARPGSQQRQQFSHWFSLARIGHGSRSAVAPGTCFFSSALSAPLQRSSGAGRRTRPSPSPCGPPREEPLENRHRARTACRAISRSPPEHRASQARQKSDRAVRRPPGPCVRKGTKGSFSPPTGEPCARKASVIVFCLGIALSCAGTGKSLAAAIARPPRLRAGSLGTRAFTRATASPWHTR